MFLFESKQTKKKRAEAPKGVGERLNKRIQIQKRYSVRIGCGNYVLKRNFSGRLVDASSDDSDL